MSDLIKSACPFCGSKDIRFTGYPGMYQNSHCECKDCHTIGPAVFVDDEKAATEAWNRRTQPEANAPAQALSAAIPNWSGIADRLNELDKAIVQSTNLTPQSKPRRLLYAILHEVCSSPTNAPSAGDRVDAERYRAIRNRSSPGLAIVDLIGLRHGDLDAKIDAILQSQKGSQP